MAMATRMPEKPKTGRPGTVDIAALGGRALCPVRSGQQGL